MAPCVCTRCHKVNNRPTIKHYGLNQTGKEGEREGESNKDEKEVRWKKMRKNIFNIHPLILSAALLKSNQLRLNTNHILSDLDEIHMCI